MKDFNQIISAAYDLFTKKDFVLSLLKLAEAEMVLAVSPFDELISTVENLKGFNYLGLRDNESAKQSFEKSLNINPKSSQACAGLGEIFYLQNNDKAAKTMFEWAAVNDENNIFAKNGLRKINIVLGLPEEDNSLLNDTCIKEEAIIVAEEKFNAKHDEKTAEINYKNLVIRANQLFAEQRFEEAVNNIDVIQEKLQTEIDDLTLLLSEIENLKGFALLKLNNINAARESFESALNINPDSSQACVGLGEIFYSHNKLTEAKTMFEWGVRNDPASLMAQSFLAKANLELGFPQAHNALLV